MESGRFAGEEHLGQRFPQRRDGRDRGMVWPAVAGRLIGVEQDPVVADDDHRIEAALERSRDGLEMRVELHARGSSLSQADEIRELEW